MQLVLELGESLNGNSSKNFGIVGIESCMFDCLGVELSIAEMRYRVVRELCAWELMLMVLLFMYMFMCLVWGGEFVIVSVISLLFVSNGINWELSLFGSFELNCRVKESSMG